MPSLIAEWAAVTPTATAVVCGGDALTYAELVDRSDRLAGYLRSVGVGPEVVVGVCLPRGVDFVVAVLAVWRAGGAYLPLDASYPVSRLAVMLSDGGVSVVVGVEETVEELPVGRLRAVLLDDPRVWARPAFSGDPVGDGLAYVMFTSGSTGRPKGVQV
ncbi:AMP-binding protein, partial [Dactylosporangium siamense]|uniref:AMP-binding protein n=1 Tax=Dactylosporangium siamense TaxID=685454 RepID=UPI001940F924